jgi:hypothetical protein
MLKPYVNTGYRKVNLSKLNVVTIRTVHSLVAEAFIPKPETNEELEVNHKNFDRQDNRVENLEWVTPERNKKHAAEHGRHARGTAHYANRLSEADVREIRRRFDSGEKPTAISAAYPLGRAAISHICHRRSWKWLPDDPETGPATNETAP